MALLGNKMCSCRAVRMRCAIRYIVCIVICILVMLSINFSVLSKGASSLFKTDLFAKSKHNSAVQGLNPFNLTKEAVVRYIKGQKDGNGGVSKVTWEECRRYPKLKTGNDLIDKYGENDEMASGENGRGVTFVGDEKTKVTQLVNQYNLNVYASDLIPLNRKVPDSRFPGCKKIPFLHNLPSTSIIIPFYDEWPSILLRTVYSIINRTPRQLLKEIILVDDGSQADFVKDNLDKYIESHFPLGLVKMIRLPERRGLIQARLTGFRNSTGDVLIFLDSHMEVNIDWLQPLLTEIKRDRKTIAMGVLDYIQLDTFEYKFYGDYMTRYGFDWRLVFFETFFRNDQVGQTIDDTRVGTVMVGAAYAIERAYFEEMGTYDEGMKVWGGENLEMAWRIWLCGGRLVHVSGSHLGHVARSQPYSFPGGRVAVEQYNYKQAVEVWMDPIWLCGGRLVHVPCSHLGHVARSQPYSFPGGRVAVEQYNYKRAVEVWMDPVHKELIYDYFPNMKDMDVGDLSERFALKKKLKCKPFSWLMENIWPELFVLSQNVTAWGSARNLGTNRCLDNHQYLFQAAEPLYADNCHYQLAAQGFSLTKERLLRTSLQCVVVKTDEEGVRPMLEDCIIGPRDTWTHRHGTGGELKHDRSGLCMDLDDTGPIMKKCDVTAVNQVWQFNKYV